MFSKIILVVYTIQYIHTHTTVFQVLSTLQGKNKVREGESLEMEEAGSSLNREPQVSDLRRDLYSTGNLRSVIGECTQHNTRHQETVLEHCFHLIKHTRIGLRFTGYFKPICLFAPSLSLAAPNPPTPHHPTPTGEKSHTPFHSKSFSKCF